jgi:hypothetical protein
MENTNDYFDLVTDFQYTVEYLARTFDEKPEEVIRKLVNTKWDIRECLDYKDIISIIESEEK